MCCWLDSFGPAHTVIIVTKLCACQADRTAVYASNAVGFSVLAHLHVRLAPVQSDAFHGAAGCQQYCATWCLIHTTRLHA